MRDLLQEFIHLLISEGMGDRETTMLSQRMVNDIKAWMQNKERPKWTFLYKASSWSSNADDPDVVLTVSPSSKWRPEVDGAYLARGKNEIRVNVDMTSDKKHLSWLVGNLKNVIRHELEHSYQERRDTIPIEVIDPDNDLIRYLLQPHEIEAFVAGAYKEAKMLRVPLSHIFDGTSSYVARSIVKKGIAPARARDTMDMVQQRWEEYARKRFPMADLSPSKEPIEPSKLSQIGSWISDRLTGLFSR